MLFLFSLISIRLHLSASCNKVTKIPQRRALSFSLSLSHQSYIRAWRKKRRPHLARQFYKHSRTGINHNPRDRVCVFAPAVTLQKVPHRRTLEWQTERRRVHLRAVHTGSRLTRHPSMLRPSTCANGRRTRFLPAIPELVWFVIAILHVVFLVAVPLLIVVAVAVTDLDGSSN